MSNMISFNGTIASDTDLHMSNLGTNVFINVLVLSGSALAQTESEKRLVVYLAEKDQAKIGRGYVGFDIVEMPWDRKTFEQDKKFMIKVIDGARNKIGWKKLDYSPSKTFVLHWMNLFETLVNKMTIDKIQDNSLNDWLSESEASDPIYCNFPRCKIHGVFLTCFGCQICNN
ncbi:MAG: hypothetical protein K1W16_11375 [Lachnospiraceae bacterium]